MEMITRVVASLGASDINEWLEIQLADGYEVGFVSPDLLISEYVYPSLLPQQNSRQYPSMSEIHTPVLPEHPPLFMNSLSRPCLL